MSRFDQTIPDDEKAALIGMQKALKLFHVLNSTMPLQYVTAFLQIATKEGHNVTEYAGMLGTSQSLMTRHLADLGEVNRHHEDGHGLVEAYTDRADRRNKRHRLTAKGKHLVGQLFRALAK